MTGELAFFGAFNPPTLAHLSLARFAMEQTGGKRVYFVPSKVEYIREEQEKAGAYGDAERLKMLRAAMRERPWMEVCDWEIGSARQPRTYETLCRFRENGHMPALLLGSDKLDELDRWFRVEDIAREFGIVCLTRGGDERARLTRENAFLRRMAPHILVLEAPTETRRISSTAVRERIAKIRKLEKEIADMVPPEILPYLRREE